MTDQRYGPNTTAVEAVIERCRTLTASEAMRLDAVPSTVLDAALDALPGTVQLPSAEWDYDAWDNAWDDAWYAARGTGRGGPVWPAAANAAAEAAIALVMRDSITPERFDILTAPWVSVMGKTWEAAS